MSYLEVPRIYLAGGFRTDPSTLNNDPQHYDTGVVNPAPWQDPAGEHGFQLLDVIVDAVQGESALQTDDALIGAHFESTDDPSKAKIVDLDVYQQSVPTIYGLSLRLTLSDGTRLQGTLEPVSLNCLRFDRVLPKRGWSIQYGWGSYGGDADASGVYVGRIAIAAATWPASTASKVLNRLREVTLAQDGVFMLSFRMVLDGYFNDPAQPAMFRLGRFNGVIGPSAAGEPAQVPGGRWLQARALPRDAQWWDPAFYDAPFRVDDARKKLIIDLADSVCMSDVRGPHVDLGELTAVVGAATELKIGPVAYDQFTYKRSAGIAELDLSKKQLAALRKHPLKLVCSRDDIGDQTLWRESSSGMWFAIDQRVLRMTSEPGSARAVAESRVYCTKWGRPAPGIQPELVVASVRSDTPGVTPPPRPEHCPGNTPQADGALSAAISRTDAEGFATIRLEAVKNPGFRTPQLDGQLYFVLPYMSGSSPPTTRDNPPRQEQTLSVLLWSSYPVLEDPDFDTVIRPIMSTYDKLFPAMKQRISLTNKNTFSLFALNPPWEQGYGDIRQYTLPNGGVLKRGAIPYYLTLPEEDPRFMPVVRDLSPNKILTVLYYCYKIQHPRTPGGAA